MLLTFRHKEPTYSQSADDDGREVLLSDAAVLRVGETARWLADADVDRTPLRFFGLFRRNFFCLLNQIFELLNQVASIPSNRPARTCGE